MIFINFRRSRNRVQTEKVKFVSMNVKLAWIEFSNVPTLFELLLTFHTRSECAIRWRAKFEKLRSDMWIRFDDARNSCNTNEIRMTQGFARECSTKNSFPLSQLHFSLVNEQFQFLLIVNFYLKIWYDIKRYSFA